MSDRLANVVFSTPLGRMILTSNGSAITELRLPNRVDQGAADLVGEPSDSLIREARRQLTAYFQGKLRAFDLPLAPAGTEHQLRVWAELCRIPYGAVISYGELARRIGCPTASRAAGAANGKNPIAIIIPCHRVIGADGTLVGYGGGLEVKRWLIDHEASVCGNGRPAQTAAALACC